MTKEDKLSRAAKALVDAANSDADSMTQQQLTESLTTLKDSFQKSASKFDDKINTVNQNIDKLFSEIKKSNDISAKQLKLKKLELALAQTHLSSFEYHDGYQKKSAELAKSIIGWFILGYGYNLPDAYIYERNYTKSKKAFQDKLVKQIKDLIGREPRVKGGAIYYE